MKALIGFLFFAVYSTSSLAAQVLVQGQLAPLPSLTKANGTVSVVKEDDGAEAVYFSDDYSMSSGVVLDLKLCGQVFTDSEIVCLSQGEVRQLKGAYRMPIRFPLFNYTLLKIFDVDLVQDHAQALLNTP